MRAVRPTKWRGSKVTGIDLASDFVWIDDDPLAVEVDALRARGLLHRLLIWTATMVCDAPPTRLKTYLVPEGGPVRCAFDLSKFVFLRKTPRKHVCD